MPDELGGPSPVRVPRSLALRPATDADLSRASEVAPEDAARIAARFRATTARDLRALLDATETTP